MSLLSERIGYYYTAFTHNGIMNVKQNSNKYHAIWMYLSPLNKGYL